MLVGVSVDPGFKRVDYDKSSVRKSLRASASGLIKLTRKMISRKAVSKPGEFPGMKTGRMKAAVTSKVSKSGYSVAVFPCMGKKKKALPIYYPAFVIYGHRAPHSETTQEARSHKARSGKKVAAPRKNFVVEAAKKYEKTFQSEMFDALGEAIK